MTVKLSSLKADLELEAKGDWVDYPDWPGVRFNVSSLKLPAYVVARDMLLQRLARIHKGKPVPPDEMLREAGKLYHEHILHGWDGLDVQYTSAIALQTLTDPAYRNVVAAVEWCAGRVAEGTVEFMEETEKNFEQPSAGD